MGMDVLHSLEQSWHPRRQGHTPQWNGRSSVGRVGAGDRIVPLFSFAHGGDTRSIRRGVRAVVRSSSTTAFAICDEPDGLKRLGYYEILGISSRASSAEVKTAFRRLAKELHPDCNSANKAAHRHFLAVQRAYTVLRNADARADYDLYLKIQNAGADVEPIEMTAGRSDTGRRGTMRRRRFWHRAIKGAAASIAFTLVFVAGALLWQRDVSTLRSDSAAWLIAANATMAPAISPEQLADALYGSEATRYSSDGRLLRNSAPPTGTPEAPPSIEIANLGEPAPLGDDGPTGRQPRTISMIALIESVRLVESGNRQLAQGNIVVARRNFERAADRGLAVAAARLADTFDARALARSGVHGAKPDRSKVRKWRERALELSTEIATWSVEP